MARQSKLEKNLLNAALSIFLIWALLVALKVIHHSLFVIYVTATLLALTSIAWIIRTRATINFSLTTKAIQIPSNFVTIPMVIVTSNHTTTQAMGFPSQDYPAALAVLTALYYPFILVCSMGFVLLISSCVYVGLASILNLPPWRKLTELAATRLNMPHAGNMSGLAMLGALLICASTYALGPIEKNSDSIVRYLAFKLDYNPLWNYPGIEGTDKALIHNGGIISTAYIDKNKKIHFEIIEPKPSIGTGD